MFSGACGPLSLSHGEALRPSVASRRARLVLCRDLSISAHAPARGLPLTSAPAAATTSQRQRQSAPRIDPHARKATSPRLEIIPLRADLLRVEFRLSGAVTRTRDNVFPSGSAAPAALFGGVVSLPHPPPPAHACPLLLPLFVPPALFCRRVYCEEMGLTSGQEFTEIDPTSRHVLIQSESVAPASLSCRGGTTGDPGFVPVRPTCFLRRNLLACPKSIQEAKPRRPPCWRGGTLQLA